MLSLLREFLQKASMVHVHVVENFSPQMKLDNTCLCTSSQVKGY